MPINYLDLRPRLCHISRGTKPAPRPGPVGGGLASPLMDNIVPKLSALDPLRCPIHSLLSSV